MLDTLYIIGITAESMTGALSAGRKKMDLFGVIIIGCCTALGGGSARDIILGKYPLTWVAHPEYLLMTTVAALITVYIFVSYMQKLRVLFLALDGLGLIVFTIIGVQEALALKHTLIIASVAGIITGVFGGVIRDILCSQIPLVFQKELYASVSLLAAWLYIGLLQYGVTYTYAVPITLVAGFTLRMLAIRFHWEVPKFEYNILD